ncbi:MAG: hypothetical protein HC837_16365 [Chloroflexaceae bacterium]|nr:hypothetical protein [Chloroflexaceae bacterium]
MTPRTYYRLALMVFALLTGVYLLTASGHTYSIDEELMFGVTESLVLRGNFALDTRADGATSDPTYSQYGPGQSIAALPLYGLGRTIASVFPENAYPWLTRAIVCWLNAFVTAGIGALMVLAGGWLGYAGRAAVGTALLYGLATMAWPHSKTFFAEPLAALLTFAAFALVIRACLPATYAPTAHLLLAMAGLLASLALLVKIQAGLALPFLAMHVVLQIGLCCAATMPAGRWRTLSAWWQVPILRLALSRLAAWTFGVLVALALIGLYQATLFGSPERSGYGTIGAVLSNLFISYPGERLFTLLFSSGRGIFWYAPPLLLWPIAIWLFWRQRWPIALITGLMAVAHLVFYALVKYFGDGAWGPRYLNIVLPFLVFPLVAFLAGLRGWRQTPWRQAALLLTLLLAFPVQLGALTINPAMYIMEVDRRDRYYELQNSPIIGHLSIAAAQLAQWYAIHAAPESAALLRGFSYSEGRRSQGEQLPRWTLPTADIGLRPPDRTHLSLHMGLLGCLPEPLPPADVHIALNQTPLFHTTPCPPRVYHLLLPARSAQLTLQSDPWQPADAGIERQGRWG